MVGRCSCNVQPVVVVQDPLLQLAELWSRHEAELVGRRAHARR